MSTAIPTSAAASTTPAPSARRRFRHQQAEPLDPAGPDPAAADGRANLERSMRILARLARASGGAIGLSDDVIRELLIQSLSSAAGPEGRRARRVERYRRILAAEVADIPGIDELSAGEASELARATFDSEAGTGATAGRRDVFAISEIRASGQSAVLGTYATFDEAIAGIGRRVVPSPGLPALRVYRPVGPSDIAAVVEIWAVAECPSSVVATYRVSEMVIEDDDRGCGR